MSAQPLPALTSGRGAFVRPGRLLGKGGQGAVYEVDGRADVVAKLYWPDALAKDRLLSDRLAVMVQHPPEGWRSSQTGHIRLAWPTDTLWNGSGDFAGFLMPHVEEHETAKLMSVADPHDRSTAAGASRWLRDLTWMHCLMTAANLARAVNVLHKSGVVFGDFNDDNVIVARDSRTTLVDCDSMQIKDPDRDRVFHCRVFREDFTAPELDGADLDEALRHSYGDCFNLAVHLHLLLLQGEHPFRGRWLGPEDPWPSEVTNARRGLWIFAGSGEIEPRRKAAGLIGILPDYVIDLFHEAFVTGASRPRLRPTAEQWRDALDRLSHETKQCARVLRHFYPSFHSSCPWCERARSLQQPPPPAPPQGVPARGVAVPLTAPATWEPAGAVSRLAPASHPPVTPEPLRLMPKPPRQTPVRQPAPPVLPRRGLLRRHPLLASVCVLALVLAVPAATGVLNGTRPGALEAQTAAAAARHLVALPTQGERDWISAHHGHLWSWDEADRTFVPAVTSAAGAVFAQSSWLARYAHRSHASRVRSSSRGTLASEGGHGSTRSHSPAPNRSPSSTPSSSASRLGSHATSGSPSGSHSPSSTGPSPHAAAPSPSPSPSHRATPSPAHPRSASPSHGLEGSSEAPSAGSGSAPSGGLSGQSEGGQGLSGSSG